MTPEQSFIRFIPRAYRNGQVNTSEEIQSLIDLIDGLIGRSLLPASAQANAIKKIGLYERSDTFSVLYSLATIKDMIKKKTFFQYFDGTVTEYIEWFCQRFEIYLDNAWISRLDLDGTKGAGYLSVDDVFDKLALCLFLARKRGTKIALMGFLKVYLPYINSTPVEIYDGFESPYDKVDDDTENKVGYVFIIDKEHLPPEDKCDFMVKIVYHGSDPEEIKKFIDATQTIVDREKPAHTRYCYDITAEGWILPSPKVGESRSVLNKTTLLSGEYTEII
jgi:hypothetical protein